MKRTWLLFAQTVTVLLAAYFVVATLKPEWLNRRASLGGVVSVMEARTAPAAAGAGSRRPHVEQYEIATACISSPRAVAFQLSGDCVTT